MWDMLDNVFTAIGRGGRVVDLYAEEVEIKQEVSVQALKHNLKDPEVLAAIIAKNKKELLKDANARGEEFDHFEALRLGEEKE